MSLKLDKNTWKRVTFGDVVSNINVSEKHPESAGIDRVIAMEHLDPGELTIKRWGDISDGTTFTRRVKPGQTLFGKRRAYQRKAGYAEFDAICSGDILTFEADETQMLPEFLPFLVQSDGFYGHALGTSAGSLSPRTNWRDLANYEFDLPPLDEQKRIADLLWGLEHHRIALMELHQCASRGLRLFLHDCYAGVCGEPHAIVDLCTKVVGGVWGSPEGTSEVDVLALGPRVYASGTTEFVTDGSPIRSITQRQAATRIAEANDIILERSGGSPDQPVGRVVIAGPDLQPCIPTDFQRLLRPDPRLIDPRYLFWQLKYDWIFGRTLDFSRRTTNITNLSVKDYLARVIRVPPRDHQLRVLEDVERFENAIALIDKEILDLAAVRTVFLAECFGGHNGSIH